MDYKEQAIISHREWRGKIDYASKVSVKNHDDLSVVYTPGVGSACMEIHANPELALEMTGVGNLVAVITDGSAVLGLGNIGPRAALPVMEGKCVLFKEFAGIDAIPIALDVHSTEEIVTAITAIAPSLGGINLEDIAAPRCFDIENRLREEIDIPVFHDDQHGTAIIAAAGFINALHLTDRNIKTTQVVINGAGAAGIACAELLKGMGVPSNNVIVCDTQGVIYTGRERGMNQWKSAHASNTESRTLADAVACGAAART